MQSQAHCGVFTESPEVLGNSIPRPQTPGLNITPKNFEHRIGFYEKLNNEMFSMRFREYYNALITFVNDDELTVDVNSFVITNVHDWRIIYTYNYVINSLKNGHIGYDILARIQVWNSRDYIKWFYTLPGEDFNKWYNGLRVNKYGRKIYQDPVNPAAPPLSLNSFDQCQFPQNKIPAELNQAIIEFLSVVAGDKYDEHKFLIIFNLIWKMLSSLRFIRDTVHMKCPCGYWAPTKYPTKTTDEWGLLKNIILSNMK